MNENKIVENKRLFEIFSLGKRVLKQGEFFVGDYPNVVFFLITYFNYPKTLLDIISRIFGKFKWYNKPIIDIFLKSVIKFQEN